MGTQPVRNDPANVPAAIIPHVAIADFAWCPDYRSV
ncbi:hypothetical protein GGD64_007130 [Bradyrhizobium sp. CIR3A]|nr:hypothetical protein [Bradyrhizobium sp. CIR3A]